MRLFSPDLLRNFSIGFVIGALLVAGANAQAWSDGIAPPAHAAPMPHAPQPSAEFVIPPERPAR